MATRRRNVEMGYMDRSGVFHPIRASADYSPGAVGERKRKRKPAKRAKKRVATKKRKRSARRSNPTKYYRSLKAAQAAWRRLINKHPDAGVWQVNSYTWAVGWSEKNPAGVPQGWIRASAVRITRLPGGGVNVKVRQ